MNYEDQTEVQGKGRTGVAMAGIREDQFNSLKAETTLLISAISLMNIRYDEYIVPSALLKYVYRLHSQVIYTEGIGSHCSVLRPGLTKPGYSVPSASA